MRCPSGLLRHLLGSAGFHADTAGTQTVPLRKLQMEAGQAADSPSLYAGTKTSSRLSGLGMLKRVTKEKKRRSTQVQSRSQVPDLLVRDGRFYYRVAACRSMSNRAGTGERKQGALCRSQPALRRSSPSSRWTSRPPNESPRRVVGGMPRIALRDCRDSILGAGCALVEPVNIPGIDRNTSPRVVHRRLAASDSLPSRPYSTAVLT